MRFGFFLLASLSLAGPVFADDEIIVTAERRAQSISTLPSNAAALTRDDLDSVGAQAPSEALNRLPGVAIHRGSGVESLPAIRSPVLTGGQGAGSFLVLEDGVPIRAPGFANINALYETSLDFAERVEVTRGPGSALYGSNAVHGVVNVVTTAPVEVRDLHYSFDCDIKEAWRPRWTDVDASVGSFGRFAARVSFDSGLNVTTNHCSGFEDTWFARSTRRSRLSLSTRNEDGWRDNASLDEEHAHVGIDDELGDWSIASRLAFVNLEQETAGFVEGTNAYRNEALSRANANPEAYRNSKVLRAQAALSREIGEDWSLSITPFARWVDTDLLQHFLPSRALEETSQTGGGVQGALYWDPSEDFSLILGADVDRTTGDLREFQSRATQPAGYTQGLHYDYTVDATVLAAYAQASWAFATDWRIVAGVRGEQSTYDYDNRAPTGDVGRFRRPADRRDDFETLTPKLGLIYTITDQSGAWLNLARGARAPQASDLYSLQTQQQPGDQKAETIDSAELGWRIRFANDARLELALYAMNKKNSAFRNADGFTVPFARTRHEGVELSGALPLTDAFELSGWATYAEHTYAFNDPVTRAGESIVSGADIDSAPRRLANAQLTWTPTDALSAEIGWTHMGAYLTNAAGTRRYPGHDVFDLRANWKATDAVELYGAVRNLADVRYAERADFAFGNDRYFPAESRAVTVGVRARR
ncbi:MAG: TonB-dependent receptor [Hyphomonadaceae bacterium]|nr:MAG: putative TonB-dependent receptor [Caulobacteraceae bacterium]MBT9446358.1 TonB-dependent receptor [Hyphomonadaceae bacterium]TPW03845.1 MAG: putative TonB-dependent receptor [Alphaproteobacteria bacterium]